MDSHKSATHESAAGSHDDPPPSYLYAVEQGHQNGETSTDGRVNIDPGSRLVRSLSLFVPDWKYTEPSDASQPAASGQEAPPAYSSHDSTGKPLDADEGWSLPLNIVIQVVGSRGDVQPFIALGNELQRSGHRVRIATHDVFESFVTRSNLEFYPIGGDPAELMAYMVKNPGLLPGMKTLLSGQIQTKRDMIAQILDGCWKSCIEPDRRSGRPFVADAIIANPPSFAHIHCAQALGIPVHLMFTMPWSSTRFFRHPLANIKEPQKITESTRQTLNWVSFAFVEWMTWQGIGDLVNDWRRTLDLEPVPFTEGPLLAEKLCIPTTYCWSSALVPKPMDWPEFIDVCGFFFREEPQYSPPPEIANFLKGGPAPIYVGFGSIVIDDPERLTQMILEAANAVGARLIVSRGWSKLGGSRESNDGVLFIDDCPHEWLFKHVAAVVHHGGAGTAACGLRFARPTFVVPFFGDQFFWGEMVARAGAGPKGIPHKDLDVQNLTEALRYCMSPEASEAAATLSEKMRSDSGVKAAVRSFHKHLPMEGMRCQLADDKVAMWTYQRQGKQILLSEAAADTLVRHSRIEKKKLKRHAPKSIIIENTRWDPITGTSSALVGVYAGMAGAAVDIVAKPVAALRTPKSRALNVDAVPTEQSLSQMPSNSEQAAQVATPQSNGKQGSGRGCIATSGAMALGVASGVGSFFHHFAKGNFVDLPLAVTEGMRNAPRLYGGKVAEHAPVTGWKSGLVVSGKNFGTGMGQAFSGVVQEPVRGAQQGGSLGAIKGVGKGLLGLCTGVSSAAVGVIAYPGWGIYQSIQRSLHTRTRDRIVAARIAEVKYGIENNKDPDAERRVLERFDAFLKADR
ncbi:hypothetical protein F5883DRAFT_722523 [Diaporthe sp. PMI_573]|nr:hypothetical protein F5883DRAFT_722523 [Diaporthaceae sp. PMI_573]